MSLKSSSNIPSSAGASVRHDRLAENQERAALLTDLHRWFATSFQLVDGLSGDLLQGDCLLQADGAQTAYDCLSRAELCRAVSARGKAELIEEHDPFIVLALPVRMDSMSDIVAVATFVTRKTVADAELACAEQMLGMDANAARRWMAQQIVWAPEALLRAGQLAAERLEADSRLRSVEREARDLSLNLSTTYEEISLLYRLTQNLKLTSKNEELGQLALRWLADAIPAASLSLQLNSPAQAMDAKTTPPNEPMLLVHGESLITNQDFSDIIDEYGLTTMARPLIVNRPTTDDQQWRWPAVRQIVLVPLSEGDNCFGWLAAVNHVGDAEFGTVEASLMSSVAAILGIHSGNTQLYQQQRDLFAGMVRAMTSAIDAKDPYTCGHSDRVARVSMRLAEELGFDRKQLDTIYLSGLLHDVGKIGIDDDVLRKPGKLTDAEYDHMKTHSEIGFRILSDIPRLGEVLPVVLHHHEQWNGKGYPHGLAGEAIPLMARIVAVADSFDAMGSDRPYRSGMPDEKLDAILHDGAGQQWDANVVAAFFRARQDIREIARQTADEAASHRQDWT